MHSIAVQIVRCLLETGEADQDYDHWIYDQIAKQLKRAGFPGATHREFDKYQGVYLNVPGVDKFWTGEYLFIHNGNALQLTPEDEPETVLDIYIMTTGEQRNGQWVKKVDARELINYIKRKYAARLAHAKVQANAEDFIDSQYGQQTPG